MPYVLIQVTREGVTRAQKETLIRESTELLARVLGKDPRLTFVVIDEVEREHWGVGGASLAARDKTTG